MALVFQVLERTISLGERQKHPELRNWTLEDQVLTFFLKFARVAKYSISKFPAAPPPPPENGGAAASRNFCGAPARQPEMTPASRKTDGGAAEGSTHRPTHRPVDAIS